MIGSHQLIRSVLDPASWQSWDERLAAAPAAGEYATALEHARHDTGLDESVVTGAGAIGGHRVAVVATEFEFLAGSVGVAAGRRIISAVTRATGERLPIVASPASGGTRLHEGTLAFVAMAGIASALTAHRAAGLPYLVYLRNPTTGGVLASWGSLGHVTAAEPGALIGLLGPRVQRALYGESLAPHVQTAENLYTHGLIDAVVPPENLREVAIGILKVLATPWHPESRLQPGPAARGDQPSDAPARNSQPTVWDSVVRSRRPDRPGVRALLKVAASDVTLLSGTGSGERDDALLLALARFGDVPCVVLGQDRRSQSREHTLGPEALREAIRGIGLSRDFQLPLVTVIDTPGAAPSARSEEGGLAHSIAWCLAELSALRSPTLCVLLGQGGGGTALALLPTDRVVCAQHAWLAPLPPEGASEILYRTTDRASDVAQAQGVDAASLRRDGIVDAVIPEYPDAAEEPEPFLRRVGAVISRQLTELSTTVTDERLARRIARYRGER